jgi:uncharacterized protein HemX
VPIKDTVIEIAEAVLALVLVMAVGYGVWLYKDRQYQALEKEYAQLIQQSEDIAIQHSKDMADQKAAADKDKNEALKKNAASLQSVIDSLRNRQARPNNLPNNSSAGSTCTGTQLYREDAEFLAREAARADSVIIERDYYYGQYESVRKLLNDAAGQTSDAGRSKSVSDTKPVP